MLRNIIILVALFVVLMACVPQGERDPNNTPIGISTALSLIPSSTFLPSPDTIDEIQPNEFDLDVQIWSLGGNGWAVAIGDRMLIFDYVESGGTNPPPPADERMLRWGYIDPDEISAYEVYVFVTHSHHDHFDDVIFEWQERIPDIRYIFGWQAGNDRTHYYMSESHAQILIDGVEISTINSYSDVPEVAFIVNVDGLVIYHNGDYRGSYVDDFEYIRTLTDHIDIAFVIGWPYASHPQFQQALLLSEMFNPLYIFSNCRQGDEDTCRQFAAMLSEHGVLSGVLYAENRGERFNFSSSDTE